LQCGLKSCKWPSPRWSQSLRSSYGSNF